MRARLRCVRLPMVRSKNQVTRYDRTKSSIAQYHARWQANGRLCGDYVPVMVDPHKDIGYDGPLRARRQLKAMVVNELYVFLKKT